MSESAFRIYSLAIVAENLPIGGNEILAIPIEQLNFVDGELKANPTTDKVEGVDRDGKHHQTSVITDNAVEASWWPNESNRVTAPNMRRGERIILWKFADQDKLWWTDSGLDRNLRNLETVTYFFNDNPDIKDNSESKDNCYFVEVSTHDGHVVLHTTRKNQEKASYTLMFNAKKGYFTLQDDHGQEFHINALEHMIRLVNKENSEVVLSKKNILIKCDDTLNVVAKNSINIKTGKMNISADELNAAVSGNITGTATNVQIKGSAITAVQSPMIILGEMIIDGGSKALSADGYSFNGLKDINSTGTVNAAKVHGDKVISDAPISAPNV